MTRSRRGFTLLEMTLVLLIMAIVFAMAVPAIGGLGSDPEDGQSWKELVDLLRSSRQMALDKNLTVKVVVDPSTGLYRVDSIGPRGAGVAHEGQLYVGMNMFIAADSARAKFSFRPDGSVYADSLMVRSSGYATKIWLDPYSGEVRIEER